MSTPKKEVRRFLAELVTEGWTVQGKSASGHIRLRHVSGAQAVITSTPSDHRTRLNERSRLRRAAAAPPRHRGRTRGD